MSCVGVSKVGGFFLDQEGGGFGPKDARADREATMKSTLELSTDQEAQAQELAARITEAIAADVLQVARLLVSKEARHTFGQTEFQLRDLLLKAGAKAYEAFLAQKKTATAAPASPAPAAASPPSSRATGPRRR